MDSKELYTYTPERLKEFNNIKKVEDVIISPQALLDKDFDKSSLEERNVYIDLTNLYRSMQENPMAIENVIYMVNGHSNWHIIMNFNMLTRFKNDFGQYFDIFTPIESIYKARNVSKIDFGNLTKNDIENIERGLRNRLYGHEQFKIDFIRQLKNYSILYNLGEMKIFSVLICGESGIGKTELARILHDILYGESKFIKINLGNYNTQGALNSLIGSPKGYIGSEHGGELSNKIKNSDSRIILIDEFEKADNDIFNFFYELLEDGKFTDLNENEYNLNGYLIIFTTNLNEDNYNKVIPTPLLSRFTMKTLFEPINYEIKCKYINNKSKELVDKYNNKYQKNLEYKKVISRIDKKAIQSIKNFRYLNRIVQNALISEIEDKDDI